MCENRMIFTAKQAQNSNAGVMFLHYKEVATNEYP